MIIGRVGQGGNFSFALRNEVVLVSLAEKDRPALDRSDFKLEGDSVG